MKGKISAIAAVVGLVLVLAVLPLAACAQPAPAPAPAPKPAPAPAPAPKVEPITLKLVVFRNEEALWRDTGIFWFKDRIKEASNGELIVNVLGGAEVVPSEEQFSALTKGIVDVTATVSYHFATYPEGYLLNLAPLAADGTLKPEVRDFLVKYYEPLGVHFVGRAKQWDSNFIFLKKEKVASLKDLTGKSILSSAAAHLAFVKAIGATAVKVESTEIYSALDRGMADGMTQSMDIALTMMDVFKYVIMPPYKTDSNRGFYMSLTTWNKLPKKLQDVVTNVMLGMEKDGMARDKGVVDAGLKKINDSGKEVITFTGADADTYTSLYNQTTWDDLKKKLTPEKYANLRALCGLK